MPLQLLQVVKVVLFLSETFLTETMENRERGKGDPQQRGADPIKQAELMLEEGMGMSEWQVAYSERLICNGTHGTCEHQLHPRWFHGTAVACFVRC